MHWRMEVLVLFIVVGGCSATKPLTPLDELREQCYERASEFSVDECSGHKYAEHCFVLSSAIKEVCRVDKVPFKIGWEIKPGVVDTGNRSFRHIMFLIPADKGRMAAVAVAWEAGRTQDELKQHGRDFIRALRSGDQSGFVRPTAGLEL